MHSRDQPDAKARQAPRDQPIVLGAAAFAAMWRAIPIQRPLGLLAKSRPVLWVLERLYIGFLRIRPWLPRRVRRIVET